MLGLYIRNNHWFLTVCLLLKLCLSFSGFGNLDQLLGHDNDTAIQARRQQEDSDRNNRFHKDDSYESGFLDSNNIYEWTPISTNISAGESNVFVFAVDSESSGLQIIPSLEILIFLSGNVCSGPADDTDKGLRVSYSFNQSVTQNSSYGEFAFFENGYLQALATSPLETADNKSVALYSNLFVVVEPINKTTNEPLPDSLDDIWYYKLSISENDLVYQWDSRTWLEVLDTDHQSALLATQHGVSVALLEGDVTNDNETSNSIFDASLYDIYLYSEEESSKLDALNISLCAVTNGSYLATSANAFNENEIETGKPRKADLSMSDLAIVKSRSNRTYNFQEQFYITGLNSSSNYTVYLTKKIGRGGTISDVGGVLFSKSHFITRNTNACSLIFDLDFCKGVAYSVPNSSLEPNNKTYLADQYDDIARSLYANFSKALQNIPCDTELDAVYSPLRNCQNCAHSYRNWLCAVTIPRCSSNVTKYSMFRSKDDNRNTFLNEVIKPISNYFEMLPCLEMCYSIVRDCPSEFQFACPSLNDKDLMRHSYFFLNGSLGSNQCNFIGNDTDILTNLLYST